VGWAVGVLMTMEAMISQTWQRLCRKAGLMPTTRDLNSLAILFENYGKHQAKWAIYCYSEETIYPTVPDITDWLSGQQLPAEVVCAAYLSEEPEVIRLADQLETLAGAWFPDEDSKGQEEELRRKLQKVLR